jgi:hypothetical protein
VKITGLQMLYGALALIGLPVTWYYNLQPMEISYFAGLYANPASTSFTNDLIVVVSTFLVWSFVEVGRLKMSYVLWGVIFVLTFLVAAACTVPIFMILRERRLLELENEGLIFTLRRQQPE